MPSRPQGTSRALLQGVSGGLVQDQCGLGNIYIDILAHSSLVALVDRPPSMLAGIVLVNHSIHTSTHVSQNTEHVDIHNDIIYISFAVSAPNQRKHCLFFTILVPYKLYIYK